MKKWIVIPVVGIIAVVAVMAVMSYVGVRANDDALAEIRDNEEVVVLSVSGMT